MAQGAHKITEDFEKKLCEYTGSKYAVAVDNQSNALFLALYYEGIEGEKISIPSRTYPSVPCEIIHAGGIVEFEPSSGETLKGAYRLKPTNVWDSALRFTSNMYIPGTHMCVSFTGPYKHLKLSNNDRKQIYDVFKHYLDKIQEGNFSQEEKYDLLIEAKLKYEKIVNSLIS